MNSTDVAVLSTTPSSRYSLDQPSRAHRVKEALKTPSGFIWVLLLGLLIALFFMNPELSKPDQFLRLVARMSPIAIVAIGQYFVLVSGEFDLSMGAVISVQVVLAGTLIGDNTSRIVPVLILMFVLAIAIGFINGVVTAVLKVPGFITTLSMMLVLTGITFYSTGGSAGANPAAEFRAIGRGGLDLPILGYLPYSVIVLAVVTALAVWCMRRPFGRLLLLSGDNPRVAELSGSPVWWLQTKAYIISALAATVSGILLVGYAGVHPSVGSGYEFTAITAAVLGGVALGGGRGWVLSAAAGALVIELLFTVLNFVGIASTWRPAVQGVIIIGAMSASVLHAKRSRRSTPNQVSVEPKKAMDQGTKAVHSSSPHATRGK